MRTDSASSEGLPMVRVTYPAPVFRPVPPISIDVPDDWVISEFPDALFVMGTTATADDSWANVVVRHERVLPSKSYQEIAKETWTALQAAYPDITLVEENLVHAEHLHFVREATLSLDGVGVTRFDTFVFSPETDHSTVDLFQVIWMHPNDTEEPYKELFAYMLTTFRCTA